MPTPTSIHPHRRLFLAAAACLLAAGACDGATPSGPAAPDAPSALTSPPPAGKTNIALGAGTAGSSAGWGGGSYPHDMVDGHTAYTDTWAHGLAFRGGPWGWAGEACGERQAVVDFGAPRRFDQARVWHHGDDHIPTVYRLEYWDGAAWRDPGGTHGVRYDLRSDGTTWGATPTDHLFPEVTGSRVRFVMDNCTVLGAGAHGWIYEFEVFEPAAPPPPAECAPRTVFDDVVLPRMVVPIRFPTKPWQVAYDELRVDFRAVPAPPDALCAVESDPASLPVTARPAAGVGVGPFVPLATSTATASLVLYTAGAVPAPAPCGFGVAGGARNGCRLNGTGAAGAHYARWSTAGFTTTFVVPLPYPLSTGPLAFWVDLDALGLVPGQDPAETIIRRVEAFVHVRLIQNLPSVARYAVIQDPGQVNLRVTDAQGRSTAGGAAGIPASLHHPDAENPGVLLAEPADGVYRVEVTGVETGGFTLAAGMATLPDGPESGVEVAGTIPRGAVLVYEVHLSAAGEPQMRPLPNGSLDALAARVAALPGNGGLSNSLHAKLRAAAASLRRGDTQAALGQLHAFQAEARAQSGKKITPADAELLTAWADAIRSQIGG